MTSPRSRMLATIRDCDCGAALCHDAKIEGDHQRADNWLRYRVMDQFQDLGL